MQHRRQFDARGRLVVFQQRGHDARQGQGRAVERVQQLGFAAFNFVAALEAVGLEGLEVGHRRHLQPAALGGAPHLQVVGEGRREAHVAAAEAQDAVGQAQLPEQALDVGQHGFEGGVALFGLRDLHDFDFVELVQAVEAAHVGAPRAGFAAEAGRVAGHAHGQFLNRNNLVAVEVGERHLGRGNEVEVVLGVVVHLPVLVRQVAGAVAAGLVHEDGRLHLDVARGAGLVQKKVYEAALQARALALVHRKARPGNLHAQLKVDDVVLFDEVPVGLGVGAQLGLGAVLAHHFVVGGVAAFGHAGVRQVGQLVEQLFLGFFHLGQLGAGGLGVLFQLDGAGLEGFGPGPVAGLHQAPDLAGQVVGFGLGGVVAGLQGAPALVEVENGGYVGGAGGVVFFGKASQHKVGLVAEDGNLQHGSNKLGAAKVGTKTNANAVKRGKGVCGGRQPASNLAVCS